MLPLWQLKEDFLGKRKISIILSRFVIYLAVGICFAFVALILQANIGNVPLFSFLRMVAFWYVIWGIFTCVIFVIAMFKM